VKNRCFKTMAALLLVLCLFVGLIPCAMAAEETSEIFDLDEKTHMMITVAYTKGAPKVLYFVAPNGDEYGADAIAAGKMFKEDTGSELIFRIPYASAGQWEMVCDKGSNPSLDVVWAPYGEEIAITDFSFAPDGEDRLDVTLKAEYVADSDYDFTISVVDTDENGFVTGSKELTTGWARANSEKTISLDISDLASYDSYKLMAEVSITVGGVTATDSMIADGTFTYENADAQDAMENVYVEVCVDDESLLLDWSEYTKYCDAYLVAVYADDQEMYFNRFESDVTSTELLLNTETKKLEIQIAYVDGDEVSNRLTRTIDMAQAKAVTIEAEEQTADAQVKVVYDMSSLGEYVKTSVAVNEQSNEFMLSGDGSMMVQLEALTQNEVYVRWYADETTVFAAHKSVYYDNVAPILSLPEAGTTIYTDKAEYTLAGYTQGGCTVTINGQQITVEENGSFRTTLKLTPGTNVFEVIASDVTGRKALQNVTVEYMAVGGVSTADKNEIPNPVLRFLNNYQLMIVVFVAGILLFVLVRIILGGFGKRKEKNGQLSAILWTAGMALCYLSTLAAAVLTWSIVRFAKISKRTDSMEFVNEVKKGISNVYEMVVKRDACQKTMIIFIIVFVVLVGLAVAALIMAPKLKLEKKDKGPKPPKQPKKSKMNLFNPLAQAPDAPAAMPVPPPVAPAPTAVPVPPPVAPAPTAVPVPPPAAPTAVPVPPPAAPAPTAVPVPPPAAPTAVPVPPPAAPTAVPVPPAAVPVPPPAVPVPPPAAPAEDVPMFCRHCGKPNPANANMCGHCGKPVKK